MMREVSHVCIGLKQDHYFYCCPDSRRAEYQMSMCVRKPNNLGSDQVRHKPGCTVTEDGKRLEILDLESRENVLSV